MLSDNIKLLSSIIKNDRGSISDRLRPGACDPREFAEFAGNNLLSGALFQSISASGLGGLFPGALIDGFKSAYLDQWKQNELLIKGMEDVSALFAAAGIDVIFLKGPLLAQRFYGDIASRAVGDIDILVKTGSVGEAGKLLVGNGFTLRSGTVLGKALSAYFAHHFEYKKDDIYLEVHWLLHRHISYKPDQEYIWAQRKAVDLNGRTYYVLSDEYELTLQLLSLLSDIQLGIARCRTFLDIFRILESIAGETDWELFFENRNRERILSVSVNMLDLVLKALGCAGSFPGLSAQISKNGRLVKAMSEEDMGRLLQPSRFALQNKLWAWSLYECGPARSFCWWAISLPFRIAVYRKLSSSKFTVK